MHPPATLPHRTLTQSDGEPIMNVCTLLSSWTPLITEFGLLFLLLLLLLCSAVALSLLYVAT
ncbi:hypothetical protein HBH98_152650 [Parastagonospora nodorum]|nr:hypothetical protein HBH53_156240 [Parastagonospora nodorum]KAH4015585.1 hypothetical protein HBI09_206200 [Parastagonospora nodorum]KAH4063259.1 hypothetical protein HBH50_194520 [Parastagonospora nodorum]KAH4082491.1 hypothetical protein HBH48_187000 [Parastagonospora nodorum]KAH4104858.1 hypothetical protein HBH46_092610 [Parastagonospora nodorum]